MINRALLTSNMIYEKVSMDSDRSYGHSGSLMMSLISWLTTSVMSAGGHIWSKQKRFGGQARIQDSEGRFRTGI